MKEIPVLDTNETNPGRFLVQLMQINSTTGNEETLSLALTRYFKATGWNVLRQSLKSDPSRHNLLISRLPYEPPGNKLNLWKGFNLNEILSGPRYIMNTHMDTVPPYIPPIIEGDIIKGRGANDAKGQLAAMIFAAQRIAKEDAKLAENIGLLLVVSEEVDHIGMVEANDLGMIPEFFMVGEPTELKFGRLQKGALKVTLKVHGKAAHSGYPNMGDSAIDKLLDILQQLREHHWPSSESLGDTTVNIGLISGGQALNALAESATASIFFRVTTSTDDILNQLQKIVAGRAEIEQSFGKNEPIRLSDPPAPYESHIVAFNTDLPYFIARDKLKRAYLFGAGSITNAHSPDEHILIEDLNAAIDVHVDIIKNALKGKNYNVE
ncbi:unnamed protein product [Dracunculus medinensis]|uniref:M20_dimer domain-containing protein n=1 Tax=Dracunculus medinensis TaxID=318479 RepID=A0A158Q4L7_DRAME|nr:unnamed protein product [Dracunculus medinensis]